MAAIGPVEEERRIKSLDVTRGFALLGILAVNAAFFAAPWQTTSNPLLAPLAVDGSTLWSWAVTHVVFESKCITLFSMLFGASLFLVGGEVGDLARGAVLLRRLLALLAFGVIHGALIWYGDVLAAYAVAGLLVMLLRSLKPTALFALGVFLVLAALYLERRLALVLYELSPDDLAGIKAVIWAPPAEELARIKAAYQGGLASALRENFETWQVFTSSAFELVVRTAGLMLVGIGLLKVGFLSGKAPAWVYGVALGVGAGALVAIGWEARASWRAHFAFDYMQTHGLANAALNPFVSLGYASACVLLVKAPARVITEPLAAVGRMAFSNYIAQSLIMTTIFWSGRGFGLFGELDRPSVMAIVPLVWAAQLLWSTWWLARYRMGPLEWVWRRLSYGRPVAMAVGAGE